MDTAIANELDQDLATLKAKAADYRARHKVIDKVEWPQGVRLAVNFTADFDTMLLRRLHQSGHHIAPLPHIRGHRIDQRLHLIGGQAKFSGNFINVEVLKKFVKHRTAFLTQQI